MTSPQRGQVQALFDIGWSNRAIGRHLSVNESTIRGLRKKFDTFGTTMRRQGSGRKRKTTEAEDRIIRRDISRDGEQSAQQIRVQNNLMHVSTDTIIRRIKETGEFRCYYKRKKPTSVKEIELED
jgi:transposase